MPRDRHAPSISEAEALRRAFQARFAEPASSPRVDELELVAVRAGERRLALRLSALAAVVPAPPVVAAPSASPSLIGLAVHRGEVVAVHGLADLLGGARGTTRWLALTAGEEALGLAFDELEGQRRIDPKRIVSASDEPLVGGRFDDGGQARALIDVERVVRTLVGLLEQRKRA